MIEEHPLPWQELLEVLFRRWLVIVGVLATCVLLVLGLTRLSPPRYTAAARVEVTAQPLSGPRETAASGQQIQRELESLSRPALVRSVLEEYQNTQRPPEPSTSPGQRLKRYTDKLLSRVTGKKRRGVPDGEAEVQSLALAGELEATQIRGTNLIDVAYTGYDPEWAASFVNDLVTRYIERAAEPDAKDQGRSFYERQRDTLFIRWQEAQDALTSFRRERGADLLEGDQGHLERVLSQLAANRVSTETSVLELQSRLEFLSGEIGLHPETIESESKVTENEAVKFLQKEILELEMQRSELLARYTPTSSRVQDVERQIEEAKLLLSTKERDTLSEVKTVLNPAYQALERDMVETRAQLSSAQGRMQALDAQIEEYRQLLKSLQDTTAELQRLQEDVTNAREAYQSYGQKEEEARLSTSLEESGIVNVSIEERAEIPKAPVPSNQKVLLMAGAGGGLLLGLFLAFLKDWLDPTVKGSAQAYRLSGAPVIAEIPSR